MTTLMDDPSTYLTRDNDIPCVVLTGSVWNAMATCEEYGCAIQVNGPDPTKGIRAVTNENEARTVVGNLPKTTMWAAIADGLWTANTYQILYDFFGPPERMDQALNVLTKGIAWRGDQMMV